jgi:putative hemolysin
MKVLYPILVTIGLGLLILFCGCTQTPSGGTVTPTATTTAAIANPSAVYCESMNYTYKIVTNPDGSQSGICVFPNGKSCDGWAYYRGECNETTAK